MTEVRVAITGGSGFLGALLARRILSAGVLGIGGAPARGVSELVLVDLVDPPEDLTADSRVRPVTGDLAQIMADLPPVDVVFHLAGVVSSAAELDFDLGLRVNVGGLRSTLDGLRAWGTHPVLVFTSSLAVFGTDPALGALGPVDDHTLPRPQSSYGIQKFIGEQLVADYTRKGFLRGRSVRLMTVAVRPGAPNAAASGFVSSIIREPLAGHRAICPVPLDTPVALSSPQRTLDGILLAAAVGDDQWGSTSAMNLPALSTTPAAMLAALDRVSGEPLSALVDLRTDPAIGAIVTSWPSRFRTDRASALGLTPEEDFDAVIGRYLDR